MYIVAAVIAVAMSILASIGFDYKVVTEEGMNFENLFPCLIMFLSTAVIGILINSVHQRVERHLASRLHDPKGMLENGDLERAYGQAMGVVLESIQDDNRLDHNTRDWIKRHRKCLPELWHQVIEKYRGTELVVGLNAKEAADLIRDPYSELGGERWRHVLDEICKAAGAAGPWAPRSPSTKFMCESLSKRFGQSFWEWAKEDYVNDGHGARALDQVIDQTILKELKDIKDTVITTGIQVQDIHKLLIGSGRILTQAEDAEIKAAVERERSARKLAEGEADHHSRRVEDLEKQLAAAQAQLAKPEAPKASDSNIRFVALAFFQQGYDLLFAGNHEGAIARYSLGLELDPNHALAYCSRGNAKYALGDKEGAIKDYDEAIRLDPNYAQAYLNRGFAKSTLGDKEGAIKDYDEAIRLDPNDAQAYLNRGFAKSTLGDKEGPIKDYDEAIRLDPNYAQAYLNRGFAKYALGDKEGAIKDYDEAIRLDPNLAYAYCSRGVAKSTLGDKEGAIKDYDEAIRLDPNYANAYCNRACFHALEKNLTEMEEDLRKALELNDEYRQWSLTDPDFDGVRETDEFRRAIS